MWWSWMTRCWVTGLVLASPATQRHGRSGWQCVRAKSSTLGSDTGSRCVEEGQMEAPGKYKAQVSGGLSLSRVGNSLGRKGVVVSSQGKERPAANRIDSRSGNTGQRLVVGHFNVRLKERISKKEGKVGLKRASE
ncbi:hypothetical protein V8F33_012723 [Rhypophila sp. PSN 637]